MDIQADTKATTTLSLRRKGKKVYAIATEESCNSIEWL